MSWRRRRWTPEAKGLGDHLHFVRVMRVRNETPIHADPVVVSIDDLDHALKDIIQQFFVDVILEDETIQLVRAFRARVDYGVIDVPLKLLCHAFKVLVDDLSGGKIHDTSLA